FMTLLIGSILLPVLVLVGDIVFMFVVVSAALGAVVMTIYGGFETGIEFCHRITMAVPETYWEMIFPSSFEEKSTNWILN
ncbi:9687_t:CDS:1, partial [Funneliformis caledonium]